MDLFLAFLLIFTPTLGIRQHECGFDDDDVDIDTQGGNDYSFTSKPRSKFWANAEISWQYVSKKYRRNSFYTNANIGLSKADFDTVEKAMDQIEEKTCVRFRRKNPKELKKGEPWLLLYRTAKHEDDDLFSCQMSYIKRNLVGQDIRGLGDIFKRMKNKKTSCFGGASAGLGSASPQSLMISSTKLNKKDQDDVGLIVHELLHNLGLSHTQKRKDAKDHIIIFDKNIKKKRLHNFKPCTGRSCTKNYKTYGTRYDCSSIMHYGDDDFSNGLEWVKGKWKKVNGKWRRGKDKRQRKKTMKAIDSRKCKLSPSGTNKLSKTDIYLINKMYKCKA